MATHTKGPWRWNGDTLVAGKNGKHLLTMLEAPGLGYEAEENRRVIAAAPDMVATLVDLLKPGAITASVIEDGRDLLAKLGYDVRPARPIVPEFVALSIDGRNRAKVSTLEEASRVYLEFIAGLGSSQTADGFLVDGKGKKVARVSFNGRIWLGREYVAGAEPIYRPPSENNICIA